MVTNSILDDFSYASFLVWRPSEKRSCQVEIATAQGKGTGSNTTLITSIAGYTGAKTEADENARGLCHVMFPASNRSADF